MKLIICLCAVAAGIRITVEPGTQFIDGKPYTRKIPDHFSPGSIYEQMYDHNRVPHDALMYTLISKYAKEGKDADGKPNGLFYVDKENAKKFSTPLVEKYLKLTGEKLTEYMTYKFEEKFNYYDVLAQGYIPAEQMGRLVKELCQDNTLDLYSI